MKDNEKGLYMLATILKSFRDRWLSYRIGNLKGNAFPHGRASSSYDHDPAYYGDGCRLPTSPITVSRGRTADGNHMRGHSPRPPCTFHVAIPLQIPFPALHLPTLSLTSYPHYPDADSLFFLCFTHIHFPAVLLSRDMSGTSRIFTFPSSFPAVRFFSLFPLHAVICFPVAKVWRHYRK